jgi:hypothetical protein
MAAENGAFGGLFWRPIHHTPTRGPRRFRALTPSFNSFEPPCAGWFLTFLPPTSRQGTYFGSSTSELEMDFSRSLICHGSRYMWGSVPICPSPSISLPYSSLSLNVYSLSSRTRAFNHERNTIIISPCSLSSALDGFRKPGKDVSNTREISTGWLACTEP